MVLRATVIVSLFHNQRSAERHQDNDRTRSHAQMLQRADFTKLGQRFQKVADKRFAKSRTTDAIDFRLPCFCYG
jgi:hypothetical protein